MMAYHSDFCGKFFEVAFSMTSNYCPGWGFLMADEMVELENQDAPYAALLETGFVEMGMKQPPWMLIGILANYEV